MLRYQSRRHRYLMDESEQALSTAAEHGNSRERRIAREIIEDDRSHRVWESRHANLILPVSQESRRAPQIYALRELHVSLFHRRALIRHIREHQVSGEERNKLFASFYGPRETHNAILAEHRQYTLAVSSRLSTDHLIEVMADPASAVLLRQYERLYTKYFELYCVIATCADPDTVDAVRPCMLDLRRHAAELRQRIRSVRPKGENVTFERQALLARSGRYPIQNYMVG